MLSKKQKNILREIQIFQKSTEAKDGVPIVRMDLESLPFIFKNPYELLDEITDEIKKAGLKNISRVAPKKANVVVRVFQGELKDKDKWPYIINGANVFVKDKIKGEKDFFCKWNYDEKIIQLSNFYNFWIISERPLPDKIIKIKCNFCDFYLKVK